MSTTTRKTYRGGPHRPNCLPAQRARLKNWVYLTDQQKRASKRDSQTRYAEKLAAAAIRFKGKKGQRRGNKHDALQDDAAARADSIVGLTGLRRPTFIVITPRGSYRETLGKDTARRAKEDTTE